MNTINIYIHGHGTQHGQGGWGAILRNENTAKQTHLFGGALRKATTEHMEIMSAIQALGALKRPCVVNMFTESDTVRRIFEEDYLPKDYKTLALELQYYATEHQIAVIRLARHDAHHGDTKVYDLVHEGIQEAKERYRLNRNMLDRIPTHF